MLKSDLKSFNHIIIGLVVGLLVPVTAMHFILQHYFPSWSLLYLIENPMLSGFLDSLKGCLFINLGIFFLFYWLRKDKSARGVVFATLVYGAFYIYYMFFI